jgi:hypothetical protein
MIAMSDGGNRERDRQTQKQRDTTKAARLVEIPPCKNRRRRKRYEKNDAKWLRYYFSTESECGDPFWYEFTYQQREMIKAIGTAIVYGGDQALAASRGEGKTSLFERMLLKYTLQGVVNFSVLFAASGSLAENSLDSIKQAVENNEFLLADYPEVVVPVLALENTPNRAHYMIVSGKRHDNGKPYDKASCKFSWCGQQMILPNVPGSPSAGGIIATRGLDAPVRGLKKRGKRPQVACIDDPDTDETINSEEQAKKLADRIDKAIGGLGGQQRRIARVLLTTLQNRHCVSFDFTDPSRRPTFKGRRFKFLVSRPDRIDLWDEYIRLGSMSNAKFANGEGTDEFAREAHQLYLDNRKKMEAGSEVANPNRFDGQVLPDGSQLEVSTLQRYYNEVARIGQDAVSTEYDNDPPEDNTLLETKVSAYHVAQCAGDYDRGVLDPTTKQVFRGVDVRKIELHQVTLVTDDIRKHRIVDYSLRVHGNSETTVEQAERDILKALHKLAREWVDNPLIDTNGMQHSTDMTLIDKGWLGWWTEDGMKKTWIDQPVETFCMEMGLRNWLPAKGQPNYSIPEQKKRAIVGDNWHINRGAGKERKCDEVIWNSAHWHALVEELFMLNDDPDGFELFDPESAARDDANYIDHKRFGEHITAGATRMKAQLSRGTRSRKPTFIRDHWWDSLAMALVARSVEGEFRKRILSLKPKMSLGAMARSAKK